MINETLAPTSTPRRPGTVSQVITPPAAPGFRPRRLPMPQRGRTLLHRLTQHRATATRHDKTAIPYREMTDLATLLIRLRGQNLARRRPVSR
nr:hypothetical protein GCM10020241_65500 [Streptoalloteichus tenebrarius]